MNVIWRYTTYIQLSDQDGFTSGLDVSAEILIQNNKELRTDQDQSIVIV